MIERFPRNVDPIAVALAFAVRRAVERQAAATEERERSAEPGEIPQEGAQEVGGDVATDAH